MVQQRHTSGLALGYEKFTGGHNGTLSQNPLRNKKYHFVVEATPTARAAIQGGMSYQTAYDMSDLYIRRADCCGSGEELNDLHVKMVSDYIKRIKLVKNLAIDSKPIKRCVDYSYYHMHEKITVQILAEYTGMNKSYLPTLLKKLGNLPFLITSEGRNWKRQRIC